MSSECVYSGQAVFVLGSLRAAAQGVGGLPEVGFESQICAGVFSGPLRSLVRFPPRHHNLAIPLFERGCVQDG